MLFRQERLTTKTPVEAYKACPYCQSTNLTAFEEEVFCRDCEWDSIAIHAELTPFGYMSRPAGEKAPAATSTKHSAPIRRPAASQYEVDQFHRRLDRTINF